MTKPSKEAIHEFLCNLRDSGETNMLGAAPYLEIEFNLSKREARAALIDWITSFTT